MHRLTRRLAVAGLLSAPFAPGLVRAQTPAGKLPVVATFSILGDLVGAVGGEHVAVQVLVGPDGDAHSFAPTPAAGRTLAGAKLVVANGLGFEGWMTRLIRSSGTRAERVIAATGVTALKAEGGHSHDHGHGHDHGAEDPHAWQAVANVKIYVANIAAALAKVDPQHSAAYQANAASYVTTLEALDREIREAIAAVPQARRRLLTTHDAFQYYAKAYGVEFLAVRGVSADAEPSARQVAALVRQIRQRQVTALFMENISDPRTIERIAAETGARIGGKLYSDALSADDGPAPTYAALMRHNTLQIVAALLHA